MVWAAEPWALLAVGPLRVGHPYDFSHGDATASSNKTSRSFKKSSWHKIGE